MYYYVRFLSDFTHKKNTLIFQNAFLTNLFFYETIMRSVVPEIVTSTDSVKMSE
jgi:hypothetical protein